MAESPAANQFSPENAWLKELDADVMRLGSFGGEDARQTCRVPFSSANQ